MKKKLLEIAGYICVGLGLAGAFIPLMPTTPFLLLAVYCFAHSNPMRNRWLYRNRIFGRYLLDYQQGRGIPRGVKASTLILMWSSILFTGIVLIDRWWLRILLFILSLLITIHILRIKTSRHENPHAPSRPDSSGDRAVCGDAR